MLLNCGGVCSLCSPIEWAIIELAGIIRTCLLERKSFIFKQNAELSDFLE